MPELPEIMRITVGLSAIEGSAVDRAEILSGRYVRHGPPVGFSSFVKSIPAKISRIHNIGKLIVFDMNDWQLASTMGMSGSWKFKETKHSRFKLSTSVGDVFFDDIRNFGTLRFLSPNQLNRVLSNIGPSVNRIEFDAFSERIRSKERTISEALMDQRCISGVGNYIKAESLFESGISPHRSTSKISAEEMKALYLSIGRIIERSFVSGGASMRTFSDSNGSIGRFQDFFAVYGKKKTLDGSVVIKEKTLDGRTTHWSPNKQF